MDYKERYLSWLQDETLDQKTHQELLDIQGNEEEIEERFYQNLEFGTAGLRGKLGAGTNRMNVYTVGQASEGFARMIESEGEKARKMGVAIAYDIRHQSLEFAKLTASIFAAHGIKVYIHKEIQPTPILSYTIRELGAFAGVMVTASHNPPEYNGYKAYGTAGSQILDDWAQRIEKNINELKSHNEVKTIDFDQGLEQGIIQWVPDAVLDHYFEQVLALTIHDEEVDKDIHIVYTPLNGCGNKPVRHILQERGFHNVHVVPEQENPDPDFSTVGYPNPEFPKVFKLAEELGQKVDADILLATDPDSDRMAIEVRNDEGGFTFLNGNKIGALLSYYIISELDQLGRLPKNPAVIKSIVTGDISKAYAKDYPITVFDVLTGFKNIAEPVNEWDTTHEYSYLFGYEESIGFNRAPFVRDKDAVSSAMLLAEMAGFYKKKGMSLLTLLKKLYDRYGYYDEKQEAIVLEGAEGRAEIQKIMEDFRKNPIRKVEDMKLDQIIDYQNDETGLAKSNVLKYIYEGGSWYAIRPSGTEPKIKLYLYSVGKDAQDSREKLDMLFSAAHAKIESVKK